MLGTEEEWLLIKQRTELELAQFSAIAANLILEDLEAATEVTKKDLRDYKRRHKLHLRASRKHLRAARRLSKKIERITHG